VNWAAAWRQLAINSSLCQQLAVAVKSAQPNEICGFLVNAKGSVTNRPAQWWPLPNRSVQPHNSFALHIQELLAAQTAVLAAGQQFVAQLHSHPHGRLEMSQQDFDGAIPWLPMIIIAIDENQQLQLRLFIRQPSGKWLASDLLQKDWLID
jgi:proteasome lid subunit RPN8/RPN11